MRKLCFSILLGLLTCAAPALAAPREARVPLRDGKIRTSDLSAMLCRELRLPTAASFDLGNVDVSGVGGSMLVAALNESLGDGCRLGVSDDALVLRFDTDKLPRDCDRLKRAVRVFAAAAAPRATLRQADFYGLDLPKDFDPARRLVVLVHGLDCDKANWWAMSDLLRADGYQVATFTYPSDQAIDDSAALFAKHMTALRESHPRTSTDVVAHSMGGLVARAYIEGDDYAGGVEHFVMLATPNRGSTWASYRVALEVEEHFHLWQHEDDWHWTWMITDGLGEAGRDLKPRSKFLTKLNARPRRDGVKYTVVAGSQHPASRVTARYIGKTSNLIRGRAADWWGFRHAKRGLDRAADRMAHKTGTSDGPVKVSRAKLKGVDDFVVLPVDHGSICAPVNGNPPAAWEIIQDRLSQ